MLAACLTANYLYVDIIVMVLSKIPSPVWFMFRDIFWNFINIKIFMMDIWVNYYYIWENGWEYKIYIYVRD